MTIKLGKDEKIILKKQSEVKTIEGPEFVFSAGWDTKADIDLWATTNTGRECYFGNKRINGIELDGDNRTGEGSGWDENISIDLDKLSSDTKEITFEVKVYSTGYTFADVKDLKARILDLRTKKDVVQIEFSEQMQKIGAARILRIAKLIKNVNGDWELINLTEAI